MGCPLLVVVVLALRPAAGSLWPAAALLRSGATVRTVGSDAAWVLDGGARCATLSAAVARYRALIFARGASPGGDVRRVEVRVRNASEAYPRDWALVDESYDLALDARGAAVALRAATVYGALRGLETLSQLIVYGGGGGDAYAIRAPLRVRDAPRFAHRGLLVDVARHWLPVPLLERTVDAMAAAKLNVLHLHLSDHEAFPLRLPGVAAAPWSRRETYAVAELARLVESPVAGVVSRRHIYADRTRRYARRRGVAILAEADSPGHAAPSWCGSNATADACLATCVAPDGRNKPPLRPGDAAAALVRGVLAQLAAIFPFHALRAAPASSFRSAGASLA